ncbi:hypothetical protein OG948_60250 (plasmid) [Embleya sp. NBC_00888]|uniref:sigma factor-like helix-turn-helix DNA-binding protein n=1 Tax=Embleya sp. NBC_00888 TaxID=2975960 RepID=UPI002F914671|nr:hypothetical protein OG948_60250 [Embleya sp. NBC_00888]
MQLHREPWRRYARVRLGDEEEGTRVADDALGRLAGAWDGLMRDANPTALAWDRLCREVGAHRPTRHGDRAHRLLPAREADAVVLHYRLGLTLTAAAALMGTDVPEVAARLVLAERRLPQPTVRALTHRPTHP